MRRWATAVSGLAVCSLVFGCGAAPPAAVEGGTMALSDVSPAQWEALAQRRIFFGHQSVGRNVMEGVREVLAENPSIRLHLVNGTETGSVEGPAFMEADVGRNGDPKSKTEAFVAAVADGLTEPGGIAFHKYCYVDVSENTDVQTLFEDYRSLMDDLRARHPQLTIVHVTMPLTSNPDPALKGFAKRLLGRAPDVLLNRKRNAFNRLLLAEYGSKEPVFDLARLESTRPDGSRSYFHHGTEVVYTLATEWTEDGAHLNEAARRLVAERLLAFLAGVAAPTEPAASAL
jgi:hypothetical protein